MGALPLQYGFEAGGGGEAGQTGARMTEAENGAEEGEERENQDTKREEDERMVDMKENWPFAQTDAVNPNFDGDEMDFFNSIHPDETFVFDTDYQQWEWPMGCDV